MFDLRNEIVKRIHMAIEEKTYLLVGNIFEKAQKIEIENNTLKEQLFSMSKINP